MTTHHPHCTPDASQTPARGQGEGKARVCLDRNQRNLFNANCKSRVRRALCPRVTVAFPSLHFMKKKPTKPTSKTVARNLSEAAKTTGISRVTLTVWKRDGCGAFKSDGTVNLVELDAWSVTYSQRTSVDAEVFKKERLRILRATAADLERRNREKDGETILFSEVESFLRDLLGYLFSELERGQSELPPQLAGLDPLAVKAKLNGFTERLRGALTARLEQMLGNR